MNHHHKHWIIYQRAVSLSSSCNLGRFEIAHGMLSVRNGNLWQQIVFIDLEHSPCRHPPFEGEMRAMILSLVDAFPGIMEWSYEEWEELIRKDICPHRELLQWMVASRVFRKNAEGRSLAYKMEVFRLLTTAHHCGLVSGLPLVCEKSLLSENEVDVILGDYYRYWSAEMR